MPSPDCDGMLANRHARANASPHPERRPPITHGNAPRLTAPAPTGADARRARDVRAVLDRHDLSGVSGDRERARRDADRDAADDQRLHDRVRVHVAVPRPAVGQPRPSSRDPCRRRGVHARLDRLRACRLDRLAARVPRVAGHLGRCGTHRRARDHPRLLRRRRSAAADGDCLDDLRHRAGDRADRRRLGRRVRALADDLLAARGVRGGALARLPRVAAGDASARTARAALARRARRRRIAASGSIARSCRSRSPAR